MLGSGDRGRHSGDLHLMLSKLSCIHSFLLGHKEPRVPGQAVSLHCTYKNGCVRDKFQNIEGEHTFAMGRYAP